MTDSKKERKVRSLWLVSRARSRLDSPTTSPIGAAGGKTSSSATKTGAWYRMDGERIGQGREGAKVVLHDNPDLMNKIAKKLRKMLLGGKKAEAGKGA